MDVPQVRLAVPVSKYKPAVLGLFPFSQHGRRPVCARNNPAGILALAFPHTQKSESDAIDPRQGNV